MPVDAVGRVTRVIQRSRMYSSFVIMSGLPTDVFDDNHDPSARSGRLGSSVEQKRSLGELPAVAGGGVLRRYNFQRI